VARKRKITELEDTEAVAWADYGYAGDAVDMPEDPYLPDDDLGELEPEDMSDAD
jgi:hypothetical protein